MGNVLKIAFHILILYVIYLIGKWIQEIFNLFIPGSVIGMIILFLLLCLKIVKPVWIETGTQFMLRHLTFFFIPATVGVMDYLDLFRGKGMLLLVVVIISTIIVMFISGRVSERVMRNEE